MSEAKPAARSTEPAPAKPRRGRGPNRPKPGAIEVRTEAVMPQAEIVKLLTAHATATLGAGAAGMELQVVTGDGWRPAPEGTIRFATVSRSP
jgi:hypothetical protein